MALERREFKTDDGRTMTEFSSNSEGRQFILTFPSMDDPTCAGLYVWSIAGSWVEAFTDAIKEATGKVPYDVEIDCGNGHGTLTFKLL